MGNKVSEAGKEPNKTREVICSECNNSYRAINGLWLKWKRKRANIDQRKLGKKLKVSGPYLSDIERNRRVCPRSIEQVYLDLRVIE